MDQKLQALQLATDETKKHLDVAKTVLDQAENDLHNAKDKYKALPQDEQEKLQMNDTELPELLETNLRAKNVYAETKLRYETNLRYLQKIEEKMVVHS